MLTLAAAMGLLAFALLVLLGTIVYLLPADERTRLGLAILERLKGAARNLREEHRSSDRLRDMLQTRTKWPIAAPLLIAACAGVWFAGTFGKIPAPQWYLVWGASYAPRTTNGEWWRLLTSTFVHASALHLFASVAALLSLGLVLERMVGRLAFATVYVAMMGATTTAKPSGEPTLANSTTLTATIAAMTERGRQRRPTRSTAVTA